MHALFTIIIIIIITTTTATFIIIKLPFITCRNKKEFCTKACDWKA